MPSSDRDDRSPHPFPTRRSSDLRSSPTRPSSHAAAGMPPALAAACAAAVHSAIASSAFFAPSADFPASYNVCTASDIAGRVRRPRDRKSTRLNSSHLGISYAVIRSRRPQPTPIPYTTLFRSEELAHAPQQPRGRWYAASVGRRLRRRRPFRDCLVCLLCAVGGFPGLVQRLHGIRHRRTRTQAERSEEHTSELQSLRHLVCRHQIATTAAHTHSLHDALPI